MFRFAFLLVLTGQSLQAQTSPAPQLPADFALAKLISPEVKGGPVRDLLPIIEDDAIDVIAGSELVIFRNDDAVCGLGGHGLKLKVVIEGKIPPASRLVGNTFTTAVPVSTTTFQGSPQGTLGIYRDATQAVISGAGKNSSAKTPLARCEWTPEPLVCYRQGRLLGVWDPSSQQMRPAAPGEASPTLSKDNLLEALKSGLPTKYRIWTDQQGRELEARVSSYDPSAGTIGVDRHARGTIKGFPLINLALHEQMCVRMAHASKTDIPEK